ncbi:MAG: exodeoxyribonuclease VII large subunit [Pirellulaceae bacterium]
MTDDSQPETRGHRQDKPLSIVQLNWHVKNLVEGNLPPVWIEGEISDLSQPSSGHFYFVLKDAKSQIRSVIWRSTAARIPFKLKDGMSVVCRGSVEVYLPRGSYQLIADRIEPQGVGPLQLAFQQLHQKLAAQGLFAAERKKSLPEYPKRVALITSPSGAALSDFLQASSDRWPAEILLIPSRVQGDEAASEIARAIRTAQKLTPTPDLVVLTRGGGSLEDLWSFNDERVVRGIANCTIPVISGVGHEIDVTLADLTADARALTPTHAAQLAFPMKDEVAERLAQAAKRLSNGLLHRAASARARFEGTLQRRILTNPHEIHRARRQAIDDLEMQALQAIRNLLRNRKQGLANVSRAVEALSPLQVLQRGYSLTQLEDKSPVTNVDQLREGQVVTTTLASGSFNSTVGEIRNSGDEGFR